MRGMLGVGFLVRVALVVSETCRSAPRAALVNCPPRAELEPTTYLCPFSDERLHAISGTS